MRFGRDLVVLLVILLAASAASGVEADIETKVIPSCSRDRICSREDLWQILHQPADQLRTCGVDYLRRLGPSQRELIEESLISQYRDVRRAALDALVGIGDARARTVIREALLDPDHRCQNKRLLAAALARAKDTESAALLRELAATTDDVHLGKWYLKMATYIETSTWGESIFEMTRNGVAFRFLLDDIESIRTVAFGNRTIREFAAEEFAPICEELQKAYPAWVIGVDSTAKLVITLEDGRTGEIIVAIDDVFASDDDYYYFREKGFTVQSETLTELLGDPRGYAESDEYYEALLKEMSESSN